MNKYRNNRYTLSHMKIVINTHHQYHTRENRHDSQNITSSVDNCEQNGQDGDNKNSGLPTQQAKAQEPKDMAYLEMDEET